MLEVLRSWTMRGHPNLDDLGPALPREQWTLVDAVRHQAAAAAERDLSGGVIRRRPHALPLALVSTGGSRRGALQEEQRIQRSPPDGLRRLWITGRAICHSNGSASGKND